MNKRQVAMDGSSMLVAFGTILQLSKQRHGFNQELMMVPGIRSVAVILRFCLVVAEATVGVWFVVCFVSKVVRVQILQTVVERL